MDLSLDNHFMSPFFSACLLEQKDPATRIVKGWLQSQGLASAICAPREVLIRDTELTLMPNPIACCAVLLVVAVLIPSGYMCHHELLTDQCSSHHTGDPALQHFAIITQ